jgi:hypothetical protein
VRELEGRFQKSGGEKAGRPVLAGHKDHSPYVIDGAGRLPALRLSQP